ILPFIEQTELHEAGAGKPVAEHDAAIVTTLTTPLPLMYCPTRREVKNYPVGVLIGSQAYRNELHAYNLANNVSGDIAKSDYAANAGGSSSYVKECCGGPASMTGGDAGQSITYPSPDSNGWRGFDATMDWGSGNFGPVGC